MYNSKYFKKYFIEEGEEELIQQDPNAGQQQAPAMLDSEETDSKVDKNFPTEQDGTTPEQDLTNFVNFQKLQYFDKFKSLLALLEKTKVTFNKTKNNIVFDNEDDEKQHKIINILTLSLNDTIEQIQFFLEKGIASVNIDKTRIIFKAIIKKINIIIDTYEEIFNKYHNEESNENLINNK